MPPPPPPPPPMAALAAPVKRAGGPPPPPPPPPPSMATGAIPRRAPPPPPPPSAGPKPPAAKPAAKPRAVPPPPPSSKPSAGKNRPPRPPTPPRSRGPPKSSKSRAAPPPPPPARRPAPPMDDFADLDVGDVDASKFPSFTMDDNTFEFADITNTTALQELPPVRSSFGTSKRHSVGFTTMDSEDSQAPWKQPLDPMSIPAAGCGDGEDTGLDVPDRLTVGPGAAAARLDLQRCTIRVHKQLVEKLKTNSMTSKDHATPDFLKGDENGAVNGDDLSRCQGELWLKSRFRMLGWKKRYGSIVDHAYYGPVLFLFKYDAKGDVALKHSLMIVLVDSEVRLGKNSTTKDNGYRCEFELRTTKRKYIVAANHTMRRDYWLRNLQHIQQYTKS